MKEPHRPLMDSGVCVVCCQSSVSISSSSVCMYCRSHSSACSSVHSTHSLVGLSSGMQIWCVRILSASSSTFFCVITFPLLGVRILNFAFVVVFMCLCCFCRLCGCDTPSLVSSNGNIISRQSVICGCLKYYFKICCCRT